MYFSKYHSGLCFIDRGMGNLEISGKGSISASDTETWNQYESWKEQCTVLTVYDGITAICVGVLEQFPNMVKLRLPKSVTRIDMTDELNTLFHKNDVLVHAAYGSYGDTVAQNNGLRFLPENIELAWCRDEEHDESTKLVLRFYEERDFDTEFLDYILAVGVVDSVDAAIAHIAAHSTHHSDCIVTEDAAAAKKFTEQVDSAAVYVNVSTRFTDGGEFGLGCEMGISTQKLHARGPMGLDELCTYKYVVRGSGQIR